MLPRRLSAHLLLCIVLWFSYIILTSIPAYAMPVFTAELTLRNGWDESIVGLCPSMLYLAQGLASLPTSLLIRRCGNRKTVLLSCVINCVSFVPLLLLALGGVSYALLFLVSGSGMSMMIICTPNLTNRWFRRNRAMPTALVLSAGAVGGFILPNLSAQLIKVSPRFGFLVYFLLTAATFVLCLFTVRDTPEEVGEIPDGRAWVAAHPERAASEAAAVLPAPPLGRVWRSAPFALLTLQVAGLRILYSAVTGYAVYYATQKGFSADQGAFFLSMLSIIGLFGRLTAAGADRLRLRYHHLNLAGHACFALSCLTLVLAHSAPLMIAGCGLAGFAFGITYNLMILLSSRIFGNENFPVVFGFYNTMGSVCAAAAPLLALALARVLGGFDQAFLCMAAFGALCTVSALVMKDQPLRA